MPGPLKKALRAIGRALKPNKGKSAKPPSPLASLIATRIDDMNVLLSWGLPTPRANQSALAGVRLSVRVDGIDEWTPLGAMVPPDRTTELVRDVPAGRLFFRGVVVDVKGKESAPVEATADVELEGPDQLVSFTATPE